MSESEREREREALLQKSEILEVISSFPSYRNFYQRINKSDVLVEKNVLDGHDHQSCRSHKNQVT